MQGGKSKLGVVAVILAIVLLAVAALAAILVLRPSFAKPLIDRIEPSSQVAASQTAAVSGSSQEAAPFSGVGDTTPTESQEAAEQDEYDHQHATPLIASCGTLDLRSPIEPKNLTGVLFHQASNAWAMTLTTKLPEADYEKTTAKHAIRVNTKQDSGEWLDADALHLWRTQDSTPMDTSIDVGALAGTTVISPVTGTVILVRDYMLYGEVPDIEIHIQPDGYDNWDCVLIHTTDPLVKEADRVEAGVTEISHVRDIEKDLTDVQLGFFTPDGVGGNHTHVQMNNRDTAGYADRIKEAYKVKKS